MSNSEKIAKLYKLLEEIEVYTRCLGRLGFDMQCCVPEEGLAQAGSDNAVLSQALYKLEHAAEFQNLLCELHEDSTGLTDIQKIMIERRYENYRKTVNRTPEFAYEMDCVLNKAYVAWMDAKTSNDYSRFRDTFESVIRYTQQDIRLRDTMGETVYDTLLDDYEKGGNIRKMDAFFAKIRERIIPLLNRIQKEGKNIRDDFLTRPCPIPQQEAFSRYLLELEGLRSTALVFQTTEHPFSDSYGPHDVRIATHFYEENFLSNLFSTLHEGGHALFAMFEPEVFHREHVSGLMTNAMHECVSRFYENLIGRSESFIHFIYPKLCETSPEVMEGVSERELYEAVNIVKPDFIRCDADELTYSLHIIVRYELEKQFVNGEITVDQIPELWKQKYSEYLGLDVTRDDLGCLQDVHWSGSYGYFPSYALGNAYGAQIYAALKKELDVDTLLSDGRLNVITDWMQKHVFNTASISTPDEWIRGITGESLNVDYFLNYLEEKYVKLYGLDKKTEG